MHESEIRAIADGALYEVFTTWIGGGHCSHFFVYRYVALFSRKITIDLRNRFAWRVLEVRLINAIKGA